MFLCNALCALRGFKEDLDGFSFVIQQCIQGNYIHGKNTELPEWKRR